MKTYRYAILLAGLLLTHQASGNSNIVTTIEYDTDFCYAYAMIGEDSVINSRLGLLPEHLMGLAIIEKNTEAHSDRYSVVLLRTILDAYMWDKSPQHYARNILHNCHDYEKSKEVIG